MSYNVSLEELSDIELNDGDFVITTDGDIRLLSGVECIIQDIKNELKTHIGNLFYDKEYGGEIIEFINEKDSYINRIELLQKIEDVLYKNEMIDPDTVECFIKEWSLNGIAIRVLFAINEKSSSLQIEIGKGLNIEVVTI